MSAHNKSPTLIDKCYLAFIKVTYQAVEYVYIFFLPVPRLFSEQTWLFFMKDDVSLGQESFLFGGVYGFPLGGMSISFQVYLW